MAIEDRSSPFGQWQSEEPSAMVKPPSLSCQRDLRSFSKKFQEAVLWAYSCSTWVCFSHRGQGLRECQRLVTSRRQLVVNDVGFCVLSENFLLVFFFFIFYLIFLFVAPRPIVAACIQMRINVWRCTLMFCEVSCSACGRMIQCTWSYRRVSGAPRWLRPSSIATLSPKTAMFPAATHCNCVWDGWDIHSTPLHSGNLLTHSTLIPVVVDGRRTLLLLLGRRAGTNLIHLDQSACVCVCFLFMSPL